MLNFVLAPLGVLLMIAGAVGLFFAIRGPRRPKPQPAENKKAEES